MIHAQSTKAAVLCAPVDNNGASSTEIAVDTKGYDWIQVYWFSGVMGAAMTELKVSSSSTSGGTYSAALTCGSSTAVGGSTSTLPAADDDGKIWLFEFPASSVDRFIKLESTTASGATLVTAIAVMSRLNDGDVTDTATARGAEEILRLPTS